MKSRPERECAPAEFVYSIAYASNLIVARDLNLKKLCFQVDFVVRRNDVREERYQFGGHTFFLLWQTWYSVNLIIILV